VGDLQFRELTYLHYQAFLSQFIQKLACKLNEIPTSSIHGFQYCLFTLDFVLALFHVSGEMLQQNEHQSWRACGYSQMRKFAENSLLHDLERIRADVLLRVKELNLMDNE
jgi:hypothetical protein